jgi:hypothetical protein
LNCKTRRISAIVGFKRQVDLFLTSQQEQVKWNKIFKKENMIDLMFSWWLHVKAKGVYRADGIVLKFHSFMQDTRK